MKFVTDRPLADPDAAALKLLELTNAVEPVQDVRIYIEKISGPGAVRLGGIQRLAAQAPPTGAASPVVARDSSCLRITC